MEQASQIRDVVHDAGLGLTLETVEVRHGLLHQSAQTLETDTHYSAQLPPGLHISCGVARLETAHPRLGGFSFDGPGLSVILCDDEPDPFTTVVRQGRSLSCGLFVGSDRVAAAPSEMLADIVERLRAGAPLRATDRPPPGLAARLCTPIDPWFQGDARALALEARSLELTAMALNWLALSTEPETRPARHTRRAQAARDLLEARLADPPDLHALAREVGINVRSLTEAFRLTYGGSIAAYVTRRRLETAHELITGGQTVSAAAAQVGYSPAHFSTAFLRHYGYRPTALRQG